MRAAAITGLGIMTSVGTNIDEYWSSVSKGNIGIQPVKGLDVQGMITKYAGEIEEVPIPGFVEREYARHLDRCSALSLCAASQAIGTSRLQEAAYDRKRVGIVLGTSLAGMRSGQTFHRDWLTKGYRNADVHLLRDYAPHTSADYLSMYFSIYGPKIVISTACAASANAIGYGAQLIQSGKIDAVLVGGVDPLALLSFAGFNSLRALAAEPCSPYSKSNGLTIGEGAAFMVVEAEECAADRQADIIAYVSGYGMSSDAHHATAPHPGGAGAIQATYNALQKAGITPEAVDYINGHGTGTPANDPAEKKAIKTVFAREKPILLSSTKSMVGHTLGAAGAVEGVTSVLSIQHQNLPPTAGFKETDSSRDTDFDYIPNMAREAKIEHVVSNSFAFGGNNVCVVYSRKISAKQNTNQNFERVAITGVGVVSPLGNGKQVVFDALQKNQIAWATPSFQADRYRGRYVAEIRDQSYLKKIPSSYLRRLDDISRYSVASTRYCLEDSGYVITRDNNHKIGVVFGTATGPLATVEAFARGLVEKGADKGNPMLFPNTVMNAAAGHMCLIYQIKGPTSTIFNGGLSSAQALTYGYDLIRDGYVDAVLVTCSDECNETLFALYDRFRVLTKRGLKPFSKKMDGFALSGGSITFLLESDRSAKQRGANIYGYLDGYACASDGSAPLKNKWNSETYIYVMNQALKESGKSIHDVDAIFTDARGSRTIDTLEMRGLEQILNGRTTPVTTVTGNTGYPAGISTAFQTLGAILALNEDHVVGVPELEDPITTNIHFVQDSLKQTSHTVLVNAVNYGGTYQSMVITKR